MKNIKHLFFCIILSCMLPVVVFSQQKGVPAAEWNRVGMSGWQFLHLPTDARSAAIGGMITAISRGNASNALTNPASIADVDNVGLSVSTLSYFADIRSNIFSVVKNFGAWGHLGINVVHLNYGEMYRTAFVDGTGDAAGLRVADVDLGTFSGGDLAFGVSYARQVTDRLQVGGTVRYLQETLDDGNDLDMSNWSIDIGTVYYTGIKTFRIAMVGRNFGPDTRVATFDEQIQFPPTDIKMPMLFSLGGAIDILEGGEDNPHLLTLAAEFLHPNDYPETTKVGAEYTLLNLLSLRGGYKFNYDEEGLTLGAGLNLNLTSLDFDVNYAYIDFGRLDQVHLLSVGIEL